MSASEVSRNPFWYAKLTAALTSRDRLSICVLAMFVHKSVDQLSMARIGKPVKPPACLRHKRQIGRGLWGAMVPQLSHLVGFGVAAYGVPGVEEHGRRRRRRWRDQDKLPAMEIRID